MSEKELIVVPKVHTTSFNEKNGYYSPTCDCGWRGGCWASWNNANGEIQAHQNAVKEHLFGRALSPSPERQTIVNECAEIAHRHCLEWQNANGFEGHTSAARIIRDEIRAIATTKRTSSGEGK